MKKITVIIAALSALFLTSCSSGLKGFNGIKFNSGNESASRELVNQGWTIDSSKSLPSAEDSEEGTIYSLYFTGNDLSSSFMGLPAEGIQLSFYKDKMVVGIADIKADIEDQDILAALQTMVTESKLKNEDGSTIEQVEFDKPYFDKKGHVTYATKNDFGNKMIVVAVAKSPLRIMQ